NFDHGIRAYGTTVNISGCRCEVNNTALMLGMDASGASHQLSRASITGNSMEANDTAINVLNMSGSIIAGGSMQGSVNAPSGQSKIGVTITNATACTFENIIPNGSFSIVAFRAKGLT